MVEAINVPLSLSDSHAELVTAAVAAGTITQLGVIYTSRLERTNRERERESGTVPGVF